MKDSKSLLSRLKDIKRLFIKDCKPPPPPYSKHWYSAAQRGIKMSSSLCAVKRVLVCLVLTYFLSLGKREGADKLFIAAHGFDGTGDTYTVLLRYGWGQLDNQNQLGECYA